MWGVFQEHVCSVKELIVWNPMGSEGNYGSLKPIPIIRQKLPRADGTVCAEPESWLRIWKPEVLKWQISTTIGRGSLKFLERS